MNVSEVKVGALDAAGALIEMVYGKNEPHYAIYRTSERVMIHFADDAEERKKQQEVLAALNPFRNEINALIDGWRISEAPDKQALTRQYDRRIADALALAMENDSTSSKSLLEGTLKEIGEERQSRGRIQHLLYALAAAAAVAGLLGLAFVVWGAKRGALDNHVNALLLAGAAGAVGALVSIGIAVSERKLATDLQTRDNLADSVLRVTTGAVAAVLLIAMLRADLIDVDIGNVDLSHGSELRIAPKAEDKAGSAGAECPAAGGAQCPPPGPGGAAAPTATAGGAGTVPPAAPGAPAAARPGGTSAPTAGPTAAPAAPVPAPIAANAGAPAAPAAAPAVTSGGGASAAADDADGDLADRTAEFLVILVIAFFAGFSERMVKQLAERMQFRDVTDNLAAPPAIGGQAGGASSTLAGKGPTADAASLGSAAADDEDEKDGCLANHEVTDDESTDDTQLPPATGGVEDAASPTR